ncbi:hypothetical protein PAESOLCIP111_01086 [Paenibacillus solanacearum]|uniref:DUF3919 family protein n=1 Tax=Paenibacillus solanacearum TaxID=2048548 RepID=A0A916NGM6_9BACL|nr:DUF3919 family protein [Paenibacillus solanacearum]CAG7608656.1 hypothetical protein PAESOLCIP111_01086 [Paenibacillus solanacearum]
MPEEKKGLSWFRLILLQTVVGCLLIGVCAYWFRLPMDKVNIVSPEQGGRDMFAGVPMRIDVLYPGLGTVSIHDPKELLKLKSSFLGLLSVGQYSSQNKTPRLLLTGSIAYLDQEALPFQIETNAFRFGDRSVNSLNVSADIRKLQSTLIDKALTPAIVGAAMEDTGNEMFSLKNGDLALLAEAERAALTAQIRSSTRVIDFSRFDYIARQPDAHFVIQLSGDGETQRHWLHADRFNNAYIVVFDLLDETNQRAYFKLNESS